MDQQPKRRRGRPPISADGTERLDVRVPRALYDALCRHAIRTNRPLADVVRAALARISSVENSRVTPPVTS